MKATFYLLILLCGLSSCYPPRIIYVMDDTHPVNGNDSIDIRLLRGSTISIDAQKLISGFHMEIRNKSNSIITLNKNIRLEAHTDSVTLYHKSARIETHSYELYPNVKNNIYCAFITEDTEYHIYRSTANKKGHTLKLHLSLRDTYGKVFEKEIALKFSRTKSWTYERKYDAPKEIWNKSTQMKKNNYRQW